ncbi:MAG: HAMP domain-containing histidine kinase [Oscillospiraceae bacterium]|nr:HAMP domain-containing histidine kinase [Oscillospiraceae bacterium]
MDIKSKSSEKSKNRLNGFMRLFWLVIACAAVCYAFFTAYITYERGFYPETLIEADYTKSSDYEHRTVSAYSRSIDRLADFIRDFNSYCYLSAEGSDSGSLTHSEDGILIHSDSESGDIWFLGAVGDDGIYRRTYTKKISEDVTDYYFYSSVTSYDGTLTFVYCNAPKSVFENGSSIVRNNDTFSDSVTGNIASNYYLAGEPTTLVYDCLPDSVSYTMSKFGADSDCYFAAAPKTQFVENAQAAWTAERQRLIPIIVTIGCCILAALMSLICFCVVSLKKLPDENGEMSVRLSFFSRIPLEITLALSVILSVQLTVLTYDMRWTSWVNGTEAITRLSVNIHRAAMVGWVFVTFAFCFSLIVQILSLIETKGFVANSFICRFTAWVIRTVKGFAAKIKEANSTRKKRGKLTPIEFVKGIGQAFREKIFRKRIPIEKKMLKMTLIWLGAEVVCGLICLLCLLDSAEEIAVVFFIICFAFFGMYMAFLYSTYRDIGKLAARIEAVSKGEKPDGNEIYPDSPLYHIYLDLENIDEGMKKSIEEQVKSERMKIELVTNVSHDLKTPLTSIISYVDLLSKTELSDEAADYVKVISAKAERLKNIVSDLFDIAKANSGNSNVELENLDLCKLIVQTLADMDDRVNASGMTIKTKLPSAPVIIRSDGKKLYRVFQNLIDNALKYSLKGTRIFIEAEISDGLVKTSVKNTSAYELDFTADEIKERFTRGDKSRSTEGSGLGLSIAESFTAVCGGSFNVVIDGDQFRTEVVFPTVI